MDEDIWNKSKRGFPFNISHWIIVFICIAVPLVMTIFLVDHSKHNILTTNLITLGVSVVAYLLTDKMII